MITGQRGLDVTGTSWDWRAHHVITGHAWAGCDGHIMGQRWM